MKRIAQKKTQKQKLIDAKRKQTRAVFLRLPPRGVMYAVDFAKAGYPSAEFPDGQDWRAVHAWCRSAFKNQYGQIEYSWTGGTFWFTTEADRDRFKAKWACN